MHIEYRPKGVCSQLMSIDVEDGKIEKVEVKGGCSGNLQGISALLVGMPVKEAIAKMEGIHCGFKSTSCPDQLAQALKNAYKICDLVYIIISHNVIDLHNVIHVINICNNFTVFYKMLSNLYLCAT